MINQKDAYTYLAGIYDKVMGDQQVALYKNLIEQVTGVSGIHQKCILDLGCGTGIFLSTFSEKNKTYGVDQSAAMIAIAKAKDPYSQYQVSDITTFVLDTQFDYVFCIFDTINHLPTLPEWEQVFARTATHLKTNGFFFFDFNTLKKFKEIHNKSLVREVEDDFFVLQTSSINEHKSLWQIDLFKKQEGNLFHHNHIEVTQTSFLFEDILPILKRYFSEIELLKETEDGGRIFVIAKK